MSPDVDGGSREHADPAQPDERGDAGRRHDLGDRSTADQTGIKGVYDFNKNYGPGRADIDGGPVIDAVERLGLTLEAQKREYGNIVIDRLTEN